MFQLVKSHFSRYTPEMVEQVTGCPPDTFTEGGRRRSWRTRAATGPPRLAYAVAWTQHTNGPQMIGCCALLQLLLGNIGRPGGGIMALRGHASIQGSTDVPTLYHSIHGYMPAPSALKDHATLRDYLATEAIATSYWANMPKFLVSYLKSMYGDAATAANDFGYDWHPKITGDHSHMPMFVAMADGKVKGMLCVGQNPATSLNAALERKGLRQLEWLVVQDNFLTETATFWNRAPEIEAGEVKPEDIATEVFFLPAAQVAETDGSFTNTQRMLQWHFKAAEAPGAMPHGSVVHPSAGSAAEEAVRRRANCRGIRGFKNLIWDFDPRCRRRRRSAPRLRRLGRAGSAQGAAGDQWLRDRPPGAASGWVRQAEGRRLHHLRLVDLLRRLSRARPEPGGQEGGRPAGREQQRAELGLGLAGQPPSALQPGLGRSQGPALERAEEWVWWDGKEWTGYDTPDFAKTKAPSAPGNMKKTGLDALSGTEPFIMIPDGRRLALQPLGPAGWSAADALRAGRIGGAECALPAAIESGAQVLEAGRQRARP